MSLFAAIAASTVKVPSEKNLAGHLFWLRELLDRKVITHIQWADTRDMVADCMTKGGVLRTMIQNLCTHGKVILSQECKVHQKFKALTN